MSRFNAEGFRAMRWWFRQNPQCKPELSAWPNVTYTEGGKTKNKPISQIRQAYINRSKKEAS